MAGRHGEGADGEDEVSAGPSDRNMREIEALKSATAALLPRLRRFGIMLSGSTIEADELVQAACLRAFERIDQLRLATRLDAWLYRIMRNIWIDGRRSAKARRHEPLEAAEHVSGGDGQEIADQRHTLAAVRRALSELPEEHRTVAVLVCVDGLSYKEAADVLGIPVGTVMSRLYRGRQALHEKLRERMLHADTVVSFAKRR
jgi:RNA polymerase sigma-70 factor (ECF subfamily)